MENEELKVELQKTKDLYKEITQISAPSPKTPQEDWLIQNLIQAKFAFLKMEFIVKCHEVLFSELIETLSEEQSQKIKEKLIKIQKGFENHLKEMNKQQIQVASQNSGILIPK